MHTMAFPLILVMVAASSSQGGGCLKTVRKPQSLRPVQFWAGTKIKAKSNVRVDAPRSELRTVGSRHLSTAFQSCGG
jgi:hypothetical protein